MWCLWNSTFDHSQESFLARIKTEKIPSLKLTTPSWTQQAHHKQTWAFAVLLSQKTYVSESFHLLVSHTCRGSRVSLVMNFGSAGVIFHSQWRIRSGILNDIIGLKCVVCGSVWVIRVCCRCLGVKSSTCSAFSHPQWKFAHTDGNTS